VNNIYIPGRNFELEKNAALKPTKAQRLESEMIKIASAETRKQDMVPSLLDIADLELPDKMKDVFKWCRYFYKVDALIHAACNKLATFPVTPLEFSDIIGEDQKESETLRRYKRVLMEKIDLQNLLLLFGIDYYVYGNVIMFGEFENVNPNNKYDVEWSTVYRLDPADVEIEVDPYTKKRTYKLHVSPKLAEVIRTRKPKEIYDKIPKTIRDAANKKKMIVLNSRNVYHEARPSESGDGSVIGTPIILPCFKLLMYRNILRQSQMAVAKEHMVPTKIVYLNFNTSDIEHLTALQSVSDNLADQLTKAASDPNYKVVSPIPVGTGYIGGQGRSLLLVQELQAAQDEILACMNLPREFIFGGVSYSATSISLRVLENDFRIDRAIRERFINEFLIKRMAIERREWVNEADNDNLVKAKFTPLKMQDDVQQKSLIVNMASSGKVDDETLYNTMGLDCDKVKERIKQDALSKIELEKEIVLKQMETELEKAKKQYEIEIQLKLFQQTYLQTLSAQSGIDINTLVAIVSGQSMMPEQPQPGQEGQGSQGETEEVDNGSKVDDRPLPTQRPPRRNSLK
jgi:hypothetical protein